jgi:hypothetical protein
VTDIDEFFKRFEEHRRDREKDPEWQKNNLEYDLRKTEWVVTRTKEDLVYAQNLYAALCNNQFVKNEVFPILKGDYWSCSWRYAGGILADMRNEGDYMDYYCSGSGGPTGDMGSAGYLPEGVVSETIEEDLKKLGWLVIPYED